MQVEINYQCPINGHQLVALNLEEILIEKGIVVDPVVYSVKALSNDGDELDTYVDLKECIKSAYQVLDSFNRFNHKCLEASAKSRDWKKFREFREFLMLRLNTEAEAS
ncbi:hypothetical protein Lepto7376_3876 [[Leptolyngbya] sp. PCC 7376]|uniref:hypothetical protein n=1 Tax=[Leptolyngbya] sp. PCC 7376 TaxID=111781 RepID=UPI00029EC886|nr:hypothetical protein [[Leptolyngbya] sp. PCC 7376]AFY40032.1 hypothetical protein Lepto7376_3876 [[Leptolyngbya] sp. PCC 7376]